VITLPSALKDLTLEVSLGIISPYGYILTRNIYSRNSVYKFRDGIDGFYFDGKEDYKFRGFY
jgi:hypothetical protein